MSRSLRTKQGPLTRGPFAFPVASCRAPAWATGWCGLAYGANRPGAHEERLDNLGARPPEWPATRETLFAKRVFAREAENESGRGPVDGRRHRLEASNFLRNPPTPARLGVLGQERSAIRLVHGITGASCSTVKQGLVRNHERGSPESDPLLSRLLGAPSRLKGLPWRLARQSSPSYGRRRGPGRESRSPTSLRVQDAGAQ